jgi:hypothetical protein
MVAAIADEIFFNSGPQTAPCKVYTGRYYPVHISTHGSSNLSDSHTPGSRVATALTEFDIQRMRDWVERFGVEHVNNIDVLVELNKLNRKALRVFTASRRDGAGEVEALVAAIWSMK